MRNVEVKCANCGTLISSDAVMCYACGAVPEPDPHRLAPELRSEMRLAEAAMGAEAWDEAVKRYGNILASRPELSHYWVCKATAHSLMGERDAAWDCLCKAIAAKPDDRDAWQARLEYVCEDAREKLQMHIDEYFRHFGLGEGPHLDLAEALLLVSPQDAALADRYIDNVHNANPTNKRAKKLKRQAEKALGKRRWW